MGKQKEGTVKSTNGVFFFRRKEEEEEKFKYLK